jgi:hypothetical protein
MSIGAATTPSRSISPISSASASSTRARSCSAVLGESPTVISARVSSDTYGFPSGVKS